MVDCHDYDKQHFILPLLSFYLTAHKHIWEDTHVQLPHHGQLLNYDNKNQHSDLYVAPKPTKFNHHVSSGIIFSKQKRCHLAHPFCLYQHVSRKAFLYPPLISIWSQNNIVIFLPRLKYETPVPPLVVASTHPAPSASVPPRRLQWSRWAEMR